MAELPPDSLSAREIEQLVRDAAAALQRGDPAGAHAIAERGIAAGAEHPFLLKTEALWLHATGRFQEALKTFHHARTLTPNDPTILDGIAGCLAGMGEYQAALKIVDGALTMAPNAAPTHYLRGWILEAAGDLPAARASYERAVSLAPGFVQALAGLASVAARLNDYAAARARAQQALALAPQQPTATIALAMAEIGQDEAPAAETRLRHLLDTRLPPNACATVWSVLADALDAQQRGDEAADARRQSEKERGAAPGSASQN